MPRRVNDFRGLAEVSRVLLLGAVQERPGSRLKELAEQVGLHVNTARDHLKILVDEGLVSLEPAATGGRGRPPLVYSPVDDPETNEVARERIARAQEHSRILHRLINDVDACQDQASAQFDTLYEHLDDSGMEPVADAEERRITLVPCPHYRMVGEDRKVACGIHARLVRDILAQVPGPLELDVLRPYTTETSCQILLRDDRGSDGGMGDRGQDDPGSDDRDPDVPGPDGGGPDVPEPDGGGSDDRPAAGADRPAAGPDGDAQ